MFPKLISIRVVKWCLRFIIPYLDNNHPYVGIIFSEIIEDIDSLPRLQDFLWLFFLESYTRLRNETK